MSTFRQVSGDHGRAAAQPLCEAARERVLLRLREATALAEQHGVDDAQRLRALLEEALDQSAALQTVLARSGDADGPALTQLGSSVLAAAGQSEPVGEFRLIPFGWVQVERPMSGASFEFTRRHGEQALAWFRRLGRKLAIDYEHQSFERFNGREDGLRPAAGWVGGLELRADGLWAIDVNWTQRARALLRAGEYRYFSPVIFWSDADQQDLAGLGPVALTNDPAMQGVESLAAARRADPPPQFAPPPSPNAAAPDAAAAGDPLAERGPAEPPLPAGPGGEPPNLAQQLAAAEREIAALRRQGAQREADGFVERGLRSGRIVAATCADWRADYLRDPRTAEERLRRAPVIFPPGRVSSGREWTGPLSGAAAGTAIEAEDLAAYARASAAGRVRHGG